MKKHIKKHNKEEKNEFVINDYFTDDYLGILCLDDDTLNNFYKKSGELAKDNEFQAHYWFLNLRKINEDGTIIDIQIPTVFYNYPQQVSPTSIDFQLEDVTEISESLKDLAYSKSKTLCLNPTLKQFIKKHNLIVSNIALGTIHRHP